MAIESQRQGWLLYVYSRLKPTGPLHRDTRAVLLTLFTLFPPSRFARPRGVPSMRLYPR